MDRELTKQQKIDLIVKYLKQNSRISLRKLAYKTGLSIHTINNFVYYIRNKYIFTIIEKDSKAKEYLDFHGWFRT